MDRLVAQLRVYPSYYAHIHVAQPPGAVQWPCLHSRRCGRRSCANGLPGEWVVDLRDRVAYAHTYLGDSIGIGIELGQ